MKINQLLSKENRWCKDALARDKDGKSVPTLDIRYYDQGRRPLDLGQKAYSFSLYGAICKCYEYDDHERVVDKIHQALKKVIGRDMVIAVFNNHEQTTFEQIKKVIQEAEV